MGRLGCLAKVLAGALGLAGLAWGGLCLWVGSGALDGRVSAWASREARVPVTIRGLSLGFFGTLAAASVEVRDPRGELAASVGPVRAGFGGLAAEAPWLAVEVAGGAVHVRTPSWIGYPPAGPPAPPGAGAVPDRPAFGSTGLATRGVLEVDPSWLVAVTVVGLAGSVSWPEVGYEGGYRELTGELRLGSDGRARVTRGGLLVSERLRFAVGFEGDPQRARLAVGLSECEVADLLVVPPLSAIALQLGARGVGKVRGEVVFRTAVGGPGRLEGQVSLTGAGIEAGGEALAGPVTGSWTFAGDPGTEVRGELALDSLAAPLVGLPLVLTAARGELAIGPERVRVERLRGRTRLGPTGLGLLLDFGAQGRQELALELGGGPGAWLASAAVKGSLGELTVREAVLSGEGTDLVVSASVLPDGVDPPTWKVERAKVSGRLPDRSVNLENLSGLLYLDAEGGYSFSLAGPGGTAFRGQLDGGNRLRLWIGTGAGGLVAVVLGSA